MDRRYGAMPAERGRDRLTSWKEVAEFFGKTERTVMRWESERGLPVRRLPGRARSGIYADTVELEAWLRQGGAAETAPLPVPAAPAAEDPGVVTAAAEKRPVPRGLRRYGYAAGAAVAVSAALAGAALPRRPLPPPPQAAQVLYLQGLQDWAQRNPAALNRAAEEFRAAIRLDDRYAQAYVGLANSYILLREYTAMPGAQAYALARAAAARAIALQPGLPDAHAAYGFVLLYGDWQFAAGLAELARAIALEPDNPGLQHWYATALMAVGQHEAALVHIERALELDPGAPAVQADRALVLFSQERYGEARALLGALVAANPDFLSPHAYLAVLALATGDDQTYLREEAARARLQHDLGGAAIARAAQAGYQAGGHAGMLRALIAGRLAALEAGTGSASEVARAYAAMGDKAETLAYITRAIERRDQNAFADVNNGMFRKLLGDAALAPLRARLGLPE